MKKIFIILFISITIGAGAQHVSDATIDTYINANIIPNAANAIKAAKMNLVLNYLCDSKLNKDSTAIITISGDTLFAEGDTLVFGSSVTISGDTIFVAGIGGTDTLVVSGTNYWSLSGDDITNNNTGKVTINGDSTYFYPLPDEALKVGRILTVLTNGELEWASPILLYNDTQDSLVKTPSEFTTWLRDTTDGYIYPANITDNVSIGSDNHNRRELEINGDSYTNAAYYNYRSPRQGGVIFAFDDGLDDHYDQVFPIFQAHNAIGHIIIITSFIGTPGFMTWPEVKEMYDAGWEVACHTNDNVRLDTCTEAECIYQFESALDSFAKYGIDNVQIYAGQGGYSTRISDAVGARYFKGQRTGNPGLLPYMFNNMDLGCSTIPNLITSAGARDSLNRCLSEKRYFIINDHVMSAARLDTLESWLLYAQSIGLPVTTCEGAIDSCGNNIVTANFRVGSMGATIDSLWGDVYHTGVFKMPATATNKARGIIKIGVVNALFLPGLGSNLMAGGAGNFTMTGTNNTGVGYNAFLANTSGLSNTVVGSLALDENTDGTYNTAVGVSALAELKTGDYNTAVGVAAGGSNESADGLTAFGYGALNKATVIACAMGYNAGFSLTTGIGNTYFGNYAGQTNTTSNYNTFLGRSAGYSITGAANTAVGYLAINGTSTGTGAANTAVGTEACKDISSGNWNTGLGYRTLFGITTGISNTAVGMRSLYTLTTASNNTAVGYHAGYTNNGSNNTYVGMESGFLNSSGTNNINVGYRSGYNETGSYKSYWASDSTSYQHGMRTDSKLLMYGDQTNAAKSAHTMNIFAKVAIGEYKIPAYPLDVTGDIYTSASVRVNDSLKFIGAGTIMTSGNGALTINSGTGSTVMTGGLTINGLVLDTGIYTALVIEGNVVKKQLIGGGTGDLVWGDTTTLATQYYVADYISDRNFLEWSDTTASAGVGVATAADIRTAAVADGATTLTTGDQVRDYVVGLGYTTNTGTVTSIATTSPLTGGTITTTGTIAIQADTLAAWRVGFGKAGRAIQIGDSSATAAGNYMTKKYGTDTFSPKATFNGTVGATTPSTIVGTTIQANTGFLPDATDGAYLGTTSAQFSDLFLAEGGVVNWDNGDATLTQAGNVVTLAGADFSTDGNDIDADTVVANAYMLAIPASDHLTKGITIKYKAHENVAIGDVCYINADWEAQIGDADAIATATVTLMAAETISANATGLFLIEGVARDDTWNWSPGKIYLTVTGTSGNTLSQTAVSGTDDVVRIVGWALSADAMMFKVDQTDIELN